MPRILLLLTVFAAAPAAADITTDFHDLLEENWQWQLDENPVRASFLGDKRANDRWTNNSLAAIAARQEKTREFLRRLLAMDPSLLSDEDRLNYDLFRRDLQNDVDGFRFKSYLMPINQRGGVQTLEIMAERLRPSTLPD